MEQIHRHSERSRADRTDLFAVLDAGFVATLSTVLDGRPWVVPMLYARDGDRILLHGSTGAGALRQVAAGTPMALCVTHIDGIVVAHTTFDSSANYRSAVVHGIPQTLDGEEKVRALDLLSDRILPGRSGEVPHNTTKDYAATLAMALPITDGQWTVKVRTGGPADTPPGTEVWTGVVPMRITYGEPEAEPQCTADLPPSVRALEGR